MLHGPAHHAQMFDEDITRIRAFITHGDIQRDQIYLLKPTVRFHRYMGRWRHPAGVFQTLKNDIRSVSSNLTLTIGPTHQRNMKLYMIYNTSRRIYEHLHW